MLQRMEISLITIPGVSNVDSKTSAPKSWFLSPALRAGELSFNLKLTPAEVTTLDTFYDTTTASGAIEFDYTHPRTSAAVTARFVSIPQYSEVEGVLYNCAIQLEILP